ncbi:PARL-like protein [Mya arenaria]|uniref:rhomboid protease n=1 Tax=Mya arenaria TaxID=6604 RepID=A0ABY7G6M6_MYAAR|nr:PARL-like protein [Mya arenaria]
MGVTKPIRAANSSTFRGQLIMGNGMGINVKKPFTCAIFLANTQKKSNSLLGATLSGISHTNGLHLFVNMYVFSSFIPLLLPIFGKEQLTAIFLGGATFSSVTSTLQKLGMKSMIPSVGASGGILSVVAIMCLLYPKEKLAIAFVDKIIPHSFEARSAVIGLVLLDITGIVLGWKVFDHAGHLGGVMFGIWYAKYGQKLFREYQKIIYQGWHKFRS